MKTRYLLLFLIFSFMSYGFTKGNNGVGNEDAVISKIHDQSNPYENDTLRVFQNDPAVFKRIEDMIRRPCSDPEMMVRYELINPKDGAYYLIYNSNKQLIMEGKYTSEYNYDGQTYKRGDFYNSKRYYYKKNASLELINYMEDGRNIKIEYYDGKEHLKKIKYLDKKTEGITKVEIYKKSRLKETLIYTSFRKYNIIKGNN